MGEFYGSSYIVNPRGTIEAQASYDQDELLVTPKSISTWCVRCATPGSSSATAVLNLTVR